MELDENVTAPDPAAMFRSVVAIVSSLLYVKAIAAPTAAVEPAAAPSASVFTLPLCVASAVKAPPTVSRPPPSAAARVS
jgi:hypothetical protein